MPPYPTNNRINANNNHHNINNRQTMSATGRTVERALNIDSVFRSNVLVTPSTDMQVNLPMTVNNVVEMCLTQVEVPTTYYNVSKSLGNRTFVINDSTSSPKVVRVPDGRYQLTHDQDKGNGTKVAMDLEVAVNKAMHTAGVSKDLVFTVDKASMRGVFATTPTGTVKEATLFFNVDEEGATDSGSLTSGGMRTKLGWLLGFRAGTYHLKAPSISPTAVSVASEAAAYMPLSRYMYVVVDDYSNDAYENFTSVFHDSLNTKNVLSRVDVADTVDHTKWTTTPRIYKGPVNLSKMRVTLTDELGRLVDLNGVDWSAVLRLRCVVDR